VGDEQPPRSAVARFLDVPVNGRIKIPCEELPPQRRDGREFRVFQLRRTFLATRPGTLEFSTSNFEFSRLVQRARSLFESDQMEDFYAICPGFSIEVRAVPETNRPFEWTGAVGDLDATRRVDRRDVDAGDSIKLTVSWMGEGNLEFFEAPDIARLDEFRGFRVLGTESEFTGDERRVTYDLVPITGELSEIPPVPLWTFDPKIEDYRKVLSDSVEIRVRELDGVGLGAEEEGGVVLDIRDIKPHRSARRPIPRPGSFALLGAALAIPGLWLLARVVVRRRGDPNAPAARRRRAARRNLARELGRAGDASAQARALYAFLAARSGEADQAWIGRDAAQWSQERGVKLDAQAIAQLDKLTEQLDERAYAGSSASGGVDRAVILNTADALLKGGL